MTPTAAFTFFATKVAKGRRIPFEDAVDPFYSDQNRERLRKSIAQMEAIGNEAPDKKEGIIRRNQLNMVLLPDCR